MRREVLVVVLVVVAVFWAGASQASLVRSFSLQDLYREADLVVVGEVSCSSSFWNEAHDTIYTEHTIALERAAKGKPGDQVIVRLMGGTVDGKTLRVAGNAQVEKGERVLLVLRKAGGFHVVIGMSQGKWSVRQLDGVDHVWRGKSLNAQSRQPGEKPLEKLLDLMRRPGSRKPGE